MNSTSQSSCDNPTKSTNLCTSPQAPPAKLSESQSPTGGHAVETMPKENPDNKPLDSATKEFKETNTKPLDSETKDLKEPGTKPLDLATKDLKELDTKPLDSATKELKEPDTKSLDSATKELKEPDTESHDSATKELKELDTKSHDSATKELEESNTKSLNSATKELKEPDTKLTANPPEAKFINPAIKDPRLGTTSTKRMVGMDFRQSFSTFLSEVYLKFDEYSIGPNESSSILVTNIPLTVTSEQLSARFKLFGPISKVELPKCPLTYANLGIAKIVFGDGIMKHPASAQPALDAVAYQENIIVGGATLSVRLDPLGLHLTELMAVERARASSNISNLIQPPQINIPVPVAPTVSDEPIANPNNDVNSQPPSHPPTPQIIKPALAERGVMVEDITKTPQGKSSQPEPVTESFDASLEKHPNKVLHRRSEEVSDFPMEDHPDHPPIHYPDPNFYRPAATPPYSKFAKVSPRRFDHPPSEVSEEGGPFSRSPREYRRKPIDNPRAFRNGYGYGDGMRDRGNPPSQLPRDTRGGSASGWYDSPRSQRQVKDNLPPARFREPMLSDEGYGKDFQYPLQPPREPKEPSPELNLPFMTRALHWPQDPYPFPEFIANFPNLPILTSQVEDSPRNSRTFHTVPDQPIPPPVLPPPGPKIDHCISFDSKYLPLFIATEEELMTHFQKYHPREVTKEQRCWVVIFESEDLAAVCLNGPEAQNFRGYHLTGKLQPLEQFRNPATTATVAQDTQPPAPTTAHKILPSTGLPSFKKFTNTLRSNHVDLETFTPQAGSTDIQPSPLDRANGRPGKPHGNHAPFHQSLSPRSKLLDPTESPKHSGSSMGDTPKEVGRQGGSLLPGLPGVGSKHVDGPIPGGADYLGDRLTLILDSDKVESEEEEGDRPPLPENPSGCARTERLIQFDAKFKPYRQKIKFSATGLRRGLQPSRWIPISSKAREQSRALDDAGRRIALSRSGIHDWGLFTLVPLKKGELVIEYVGELIRSNLADVRERQYLASGIDSSYLFRLDDEYVVDATTQGNIARFINHSCQPNCLARIVRSESRPRILIYAKMDIPRHQEITYDYQFPLEDEEHKIKCLCQAPGCRGYLN